jgi:dethiobiotin synthetase
MTVDTDQRGLFVTGTSTGVGKTAVTGALACYLREQGIDVGVCKPCETGVTDIAKPGDDGELLRWAAASTDSIEQTCPLRFNVPAAPATAARLEKRKIDYSALVQTTQELIRRHRFTLIEGAGGLMVPLAGGILVADLVRDLNLPLLVVADARLGTINHSLLTLLAARYFELNVAGYLINRMPAAPLAAEKAVPHDLASLTHAELLGVLPELTGSPREVVQKLADGFPELPTWGLWRQHLPLPL